MSKKGASDNLVKIARAFIADQKRLHESTKHTASTEGNIHTEQESDFCFPPIWDEEKLTNYTERLVDEVFSMPDKLEIEVKKIGVSSQNFVVNGPVQVKLNQNISAPSTFNKPVMRKQKSRSVGTNVNFVTKRMNRSFMNQQQPNKNVAENGDCFQRFLLLNNPGYNVTSRIHVKDAEVQTDYEPITELEKIDYERPIEKTLDYSLRRVKLPSICLKDTCSIQENYNIAITPALKNGSNVIYQEIFETSLIDKVDAETQYSPTPSEGTESLMFSNRNNENVKMFLKLQENITNDKDELLSLNNTISELLKALDNLDDAIY